MILYAFMVFVAVFVYFKYLKKGPEDYEILSQYYGDKCWTVDEEVVDTEIKPFKLEIPEERLDDLKRRLNSVRLPTPSLKDSKFTYGVNRNFMEKFVEYWKSEFDWREQEKELNKYPNFKTKIEGLDIHFIHVKPKTTSTNSQPRPVLIVHGWPGSVFEFYKLIPRLVDPTLHGGNETDSFEVIAPSIPGYGFSQASEVIGLSSLHVARIFHKLMVRLGHKNYYVQGGDWGALITTHLAMLYPSNVKGQHFTMYTLSSSGISLLKMIAGSVSPLLFFDEEDAKKIFPLKTTFFDMIQESGYLHLQGTKPDTVGFALTDSPVGLAAYILEKFSTWTNKKGREADDGDILRYWTYDEILTNIMIYWWSGNITSSMRFYKESIKDAFKTQNVKVRVPSGFGWFPHEFFAALKSQVRQQHERLIAFTRMEDGGHFAAFQVPELLAKDFVDFVRKVEELENRQALFEARHEKDFQ